MRFVVVLLLVFSASIAHAQIVNVQGAIAKPPEKDGVKGQIDMRLSWTDGNAPAFNAGGAASVVIRYCRTLTLAVVSGEYGTARGVTNSQKTFEHLRERYFIGNGWRWEGFAQHEYDRFRRLSFRALIGTGPAYQIVAQEDFALLAGTSYMFLVEELAEGDTMDSGETYAEHRLNAYLTGHEKIVENVAFNQTIYVQPRFDAFSDFRLLGEASLQVKLSKRFAITDGFVLSYDSRPPQNVGKWDTTLKVGLVITI